MNINKFKKFLVKEGYVLDGPIMLAMTEPLKKFLEGNPVPSLNFDQLHDLAKKYATIHIDSCSRDRYLGLHAFIRWLTENGVETNKEQPILDLTKIKDVKDLFNVNWMLYWDKDDKKYIRYINYPVSQNELDRICNMSHGHLYNSMGELFLT